MFFVALLDFLLSFWYNARMKKLKLSNLLACASFLAFAAAAFTASGVEVVDLTAAARTQSGITATASSQYGANYTPGKAFDGDWSKTSDNPWRSASDGGVDQWLACQFGDSFESGKAIRVLSYSI